MVFGVFQKILYGVVGFEMHILSREGLPLEPQGSREGNTFYLS